MKPPPFAYVAAESGDEAVSLLAEHGDDARLLAGGQSFLPVLNMRLSRPSVVVDIGRAGDLAGIARNGSLTVGATTTLREVERSADVRAAAPVLAQAMTLVGHPSIRTRGTAGGSAAHADPAAELPAVLVALDATIVARGAGGERRIAASDFYVSHFTTTLAEGEVLTAIEIPSQDGRAAGIVEITRRHGDFALIGAVASVTRDGATCADARVVLFGAGETPMRITAAEDALRGSDLDADALTAAGAAAAAGIDPGDDLHASAAYRREVAAVVTRRAIAEAIGKES